MFATPTTPPNIEENVIFKIVMKDKIEPKYIDPNTQEISLPNPFFAKIIITSKLD